MATKLGLAGDWAIDSNEESDHYTSKIGGFPDFPPKSSVQFDSRFLGCNICESQLFLVAQIYAPITSKSSKISERVIYIFCCNFSHWKAIRIQKRDNKEESVDSSEKDSSPVFESVLDLVSTGGSGSDEEIDLEELALALSEATLSASSKKKNKRKSRIPEVRSRRNLAVSGPHLPCFYTYNVKEDCSRRNCYNLKYQNLGDSENCNNSEVWGEERYEHDSVLGLDKSYLKFKKKVDAYPEQCFRHGGSPLFVRRCSYVPENCDLCGGDRNYEMQLMPPLLYFLLEFANEEQRMVVGMWNWMSVVVYTCSNGCFKDNSFGEWTIAEEDVFVELETPLKFNV